MNGHEGSEDKTAEVDARNLRRATHILGLIRNPNKMNRQMRRSAAGQLREILDGTLYPEIKREGGISIKDQWWSVEELAKTLEAVEKP